MKKLRAMLQDRGRDSGEALTLAVRGRAAGSRSSGRSSGPCWIGSTGWVPTNLGKVDHVEVK